MVSADDASKVEEVCGSASLALAFAGSVVLVEADGNSVARYRRLVVVRLGRCMSQPFAASSQLMASLGADKDPCTREPLDSSHQSASALGKEPSLPQWFEHASSPSSCLQMSLGQISFAFARPSAALRGFRRRELGRTAVRRTTCTAKDRTNGNQSLVSRPLPALGC